MTEGGPQGTTIIAPVDFHGGSRPPAQRRSIRRWVARLLPIMLIAGLALGGWYVLTAREVKLTFEPEPDRVALTGPVLRFKLGEHHLLRLGTYTVSASREGYRDLDETFVVARGRDNEFHFELSERPGVVTLRCVGADDVESALDDVEVLVDGEPRGRASLDGLELARGEHTVRLEHKRYRELEQRIEVEGLGRRQVVTLEMQPDWAVVEIETTPPGAHVVVDGATVATTPSRIELLSGEHRLQLRADRFETWERALTIVAGEPVSLTGIALDPARGRILVKTDPPGAMVSVDGAYAGTSPLEALALPDREVLVQVSRDGYEPAERTARVGPDEETSLAFELTPQYGTVSLEVDPPGAMLHVDGAPWGRVPPEVTLPAVEHRLEFSLEGYAPVVRTIRPRPDVPARISVRLQKPEAAVTQEVAREAPTAGNGYPLVLVEPTSFMMGASRREQGRRSNETLRNIRLERPFLMGAREVTNAEYRAFDAGHDSGTFERTSLNGGDRPVVQVTWDDAARFCNWLSAQDGLPAAYVAGEEGMRAVTPMSIGYRLPTEAEWEYAARVTEPEGLLKFPWGSTFPPRVKSGNYADDSAAQIINVRIDGYDDGFAGPAPPGSFDANHLGLLDMGGNVAEWCHDLYSIYPYDAREVSIDPMGPETGQHHVVRGSSWKHASMSVLRLSYRDYSDDRRDDLGFRVGRYVAPAETTDEE